MAEVFFRSTFNHDLLSAHGLTHILKQNSQESLKSYTDALAYLLLKSAKDEPHYADIYTDERLRFVALVMASGASKILKAKLLSG